MFQEIALYYLINLLSIDRTLLQIIFIYKKTADYIIYFYFICQILESFYCEFTKVELLLQYVPLW